MNEIKIAFVGDIFPGGVLVNQERICDEKVMDVLMSADLRVATLECALGPGEKDGYSFDEEKMARSDWRNIIWAPDECVNRLKELHIDVVTIANNHIFDLGEKGLMNTIRLLDENDIKHCGAGANINEASKPAVVEIKGKKIAFLGYMVYFTGWRAPHPAKVHSSGINIFSLEKAIEEISSLKELYDYVFILPHWGDEYSYWPVPVDVNYSKKIIEAGADGIFGSHTHQVQPVITLVKSPVCFSLGNFIFPDFYMGINRVACYPNQEQISSIPKTYTYERYPSSMLLRIWPKENRLGLMYLLTINSKRLEGHKYLIQSSPNNVIQLFINKRVSLLLCFLSGIIKCGPYSLLFKHRSIINKIINRIIQIS